MPASPREHLGLALLTLLIVVLLGYHAAGRVTLFSWVCAALGTVGVGYVAWRLMTKEA